VQVQRFRLLTIFQFGALCYLAWLLATYQTPWNAQRYLGTVLVIAGVSLIVVARFQLGRSFSVKPEAHALVTTGLYSKIRNPIYVFGAVMFAGVLLIVQKPWLWILLAAGLVGQTIRARREAKVLEAAFGDAYREYRRKTWF
jgi:protein-S-isoprenylcysteine O-methyltransferase Ste14